MLINPKHKPAWAGDDFLSRCVNRLIQNRPIYAVLKRQARQVLIKTAEKNGIPWQQNYTQLANSGIQAELAAAIAPRVTYPDYYQKPFHAYEQGNLCWEAAFEAESATYAMGLRVWKDEPLTWQAAQSRLRHSFYQVLAAHISGSIADILDLGCSVGISTQMLHQYYQTQSGQSLRTIGLDLSPYMLTVARRRDSAQQITAWIHANAEATGLPDRSFDLITLQFVIHELPRPATFAILEEGLRLLRPGGHVAILDNNPQSAVIQNLPPVLFTLMKSTEPWSDDYYTFDLETAIATTGFDLIATVASDPRHRTIIARKP
jgi:ubiquinone/menaquinone biosynthesis C-methylase UbiE